MIDEQRVECWFKIWPGSLEDGDRIQSLGIYAFWIAWVICELSIALHRVVLWLPISTIQIFKNILLFVVELFILSIDLWICKFQHSFCKCLMAWEECVWDDLRRLVESSALVEDRKQVKRAKRRGGSCIRCTVHSQKKTRKIGWFAWIWTPYSWQYGQNLSSL